MPRKLLIAAGLVAVLLIAAAVALSFLIDPNSYRSTIQSQLEQQLRRPASLGGMRLKLIPLAIRVSDVTLGQPQGFTSPHPFLTAKQLDVVLALLPLLRGQVSVKSLRLDSPQIELIRGADGAWNYETGDDSSSNQLTLAELRIEHGQVAVTNLQTRAPRDVYKNIDLTLSDYGPNRRGSLDASMRLETLAAQLTLQSDFHNAEPLTAKGALTFKPDNQDPLELDYDVTHGPLLTINSITARQGALNASITGSIDTRQTPATLQLALKTSNAPIADVIRLAAVYGAHPPSGLSATGNLNANVRITGTSAKPILAGALESSPGQITAKDLAEPVRSSGIKIDFTPTQLTTQPFTVQTGSTQIAAQAVVQDYATAAPKVNATLKSANARVEELLRIASAYGLKPAGLNGSGTVNLDMKVSSAGKTYNYSGSGDLRDVTLNTPDLPKPLNIPAANIAFNGDRISIADLKAGLGNLHLNGSASIRDFDSPNAGFNLNIDQINIAELREWRSGGSKQPSSEPGFLKKATANGSLTIGKIVYDQLVLESVKATANLANGMLRLDPVTAIVFGGQEGGAITANLAANPVVYSVNLKLNSVDANKLLSATTSLRNVLSGALTGNVNLQFLSRPDEDIARSLNGKLQLNMGQGRLSGIQVMNEVAKIGSFLGYANKREPYTDIVKLATSLDVRDGVASTNDLFVDLGGGAITGSGNIGLADQSLKLRITTTLGKELAQRMTGGQSGGQVGGMLSTVLSSTQGDLVIPMRVGGTFSQPTFTPDAEQMAQLKLRGIIPAATTGGVKGILDAIKGKQSPPTQSQTNPSEPKPNETKQPEAKQPPPNPTESIIGIFEQLRKKKTEKKE